jgi:hypothetical protein
MFSKQLEFYTHSNWDYLWQGINIAKANWLEKPSHCVIEDNFKLPDWIWFICGFLDSANLRHYFSRSNMSRFSFSHAPSTSLVTHSMLINENSLIIHLLVGGNWGKKKMKRITIHFQPFNTEPLCYSLLNYNLALYVYVMG